MLQLLHVLQIDGDVCGIGPDPHLALIVGVVCDEEQACSFVSKGLDDVDHAGQSEIVGPLESPGPEGFDRCSRSIRRHLDDRLICQPLRSTCTEVSGNDRLDDRFDRN